MSEIFDYRRYELGGSDLGSPDDPLFTEPPLGFDPPGEPRRKVSLVATALTALALLTSGGGGGPSSSQVEAMAPTPATNPLPACSGCEANETGDFRLEAINPSFPSSAGKPTPLGANGGLPNCDTSNQGMPYKDSGGKVYQCDDGNWKEAHSNIGSDGSFNDPIFGRFAIIDPENLDNPQTFQARIMEKRFNKETGEFEYLAEVYGPYGMGIFRVEPIK